MRAAKGLAEGEFVGFDGLVSSGELNAIPLSTKTLRD
jgi:hypothetical protein